MMRAGKLAPLLSATAALGCGAEAPIPEAPTWAQDIQPLLRANCFHCHGAASNYQLHGTKRWDVYDLDEEPYRRLGFEKVYEDVMTKEGPVKVATFFGITESGQGALITAYVDPDAGAQRMPPPPALPLSERDRAVLQKWLDMLKQPAASAAALEGSHQPNHPPTIAWQQPGTLAAVRDDDGDQVLGKLDCGGVEVRIQRTGGLTLPVGAKPPCRGILYDGHEEAPVSLE
jgi:hypothetical protein